MQQTLTRRLARPSPPNQPNLLPIQPNQPTPQPIHLPLKHTPAHSRVRALEREDSFCLFG